MNKKYKMLRDHSWGSGLHRIEAIKDFGDVRRGDVGGFIQTEDNLSDIGTAWVYDNARVFGKARVYENAKLYDNSTITDNVSIYGNSELHSGCRLFDSCKVCDNAHIYGDVRMYDQTSVSGNSILHHIWLLGNSTVTGDTVLSTKLSIRNFKIDHGHWNYFVVQDANIVLISNTLEQIKILFGIEYADGPRVITIG